MVKQGLTKLTYLKSLSVTKNVLNILELLYARIVDYTLATFKKHMLSGHTGTVYSTVYEHDFLLYSTNQVPY
jgi:hypothetical protein